MGPSCQLFSASDWDLNIIEKKLRSLEKLKKPSIQFYVSISMLVKFNEVSSVLFDLRPHDFAEWGFKI